MIEKGKDVQLVHTGQYHSQPSKFLSDCPRRGIRQTGW